ncbi:MAG: flavin reductase family protein [Desulfobacterales bacterium]|jgi:flavin reductase (DIM6/NTAB) family NADH-FMN oxidoreductase RutF
MKKSFGAKALVYPSPVWCIGSYDADGRPNVMTAAWAGICCSKPPAVTVSLRKATYTYGNITSTKAYTVSVPPQKYMPEADYFGIASGKTVDKFKATGLTPTKAATVNAPYVDEFPMVLECRVIHSHEIGLHTLFVGEILDIKADDDILTEIGLPDISKLDPFLYAAESRTYHGIGDYIGKAYTNVKAF